MTNGTSDPLVTVARYDAVGDARLAKIQLESAGIPCMIANEDQSGLSTMFDATEGGVQLKVNETDREKAQEILEQDSDA